MFPAYKMAVHRAAIVSLFHIKSFLVLLFEPRQDTLVALGAVDQTFIDPADRCRRSLRDRFDLIIGPVLRQQLCYLKTLRDRVDLIDRADVLKESIAILLIFQQKYCSEQFIDVVVLKF